ncbi:ABC transporter substrate-binding protein [Plantactinospora soyae]|uniref:ABC-type glycerol-3-phosphate transport system substrate-binding protein n=1 Tax=Plantactinospora soyae TaxID=1544732 RepID=A0A927M2G4_9ACTN|nr:extracellular solute-binding protein [Plantactinospora soyae]MBE1485451.1 ABC-type glycerol-3-phosphate transport system substrate-binding protein [Plantactinospora soyae]
MEDGRLAEEVVATLTQAQAALPPAAPGAIATIRERYRRRRRQRAGLASAAVAILVLAVTLTGAELTRGRGLSPVPPANGGTATIRVWAITPPGQDSALRQLVDRYNRSAEADVELFTFGNDDYKEKLRTSVDSSDGPDVFVSWGGATLARLARAGRLADLAGPPAAVDRFLPSALAGGMVDGRQYGLPMSGTHPTVLFYNKDVFTRSGLTPPRSYADLLSLVDEFKSDGITPLALGGAQGWTELMYVMYLAERIGGPGTTADIVEGRPGAWSKPAVAQALLAAQDLAERGAFGDDFSSLGYDDGGAPRLLATGRAAMQLMGTWEYPTQLAQNPDFVLGGRLGWVPFPSMAGGAGNPADLVGIPAQYFSVTAASRHRETAIEFVRDVTADAYLDDLVTDGEVPPVTDAADRLRSTDHAGFAVSVHELVARAPSYSLAWDQALEPGTATRLNANLQRLFRSELTPEQFAAAMAGG